jgi:hypothetical protein
MNDQSVLFDVTSTGKAATIPQWRAACIERDGAQCVLCGSTEDLNVHHKAASLVYPELALEIDNGITLCSHCHLTVVHGSAPLGEQGLEWEAEALRHFGVSKIDWQYKRRGRPRSEEKRERLNTTLPAHVDEWLRAQPGGIGAAITRLVRAAMGEGE